MQQSSAAAPGEHGCMAAAEGMLSLRERELVAQLHELLFPSPSPAPTPAPSGGGASTSGLNVAGCPSDECSPVKAAPVSCGGRTRQRRGSKRVREDEQIDQEEQHGGGGANAKIRCRRKKHGTTTLVTTVPDFDGYQWRKFGQKKIEAAKYPRSYYRCINSTDQGCSAKRTVQRNDDENKGGGGPPKYTVVYISEHTCKAIESAAPVILETTVRTKNQAADGNAAAAAAATHVMLSAPDVAVVVPAESSTTSTRTESPANSDITWSGDTNPSEHGDYSHVFASDDWDPTTVAPAATALLHEMDFAGPIRSPVHIASDGWIDGLFFNEPSVLNSCHLFGF